MVMSKCPNCNAPLIYQKERRVYSCEYCKAEFRDDTKDQTTSEVPEKKIIYEYHHINVPEQATPTKQVIEERKKNSGCIRFLFAVLGVGSAIMGAGALSVNQGTAGLVLIGVGIWLVVLASRRK